jgi:hypothetical protein
MEMTLGDFQEVLPYLSTNTEFITFRQENHFRHTMLPAFSFATTVAMMLEGTSKAYTICRIPDSPTQVKVPLNRMLQFANKMTSDAERDTVRALGRRNTNSDLKVPIEWATTDKMTVLD